MRSMIVVAAVVAAAFAQAASAKTDVLPVTGLAPISGGDYVVRRAFVHYAGLNDAQKSGALALLSRIDNAARAVCADKFGMPSLSLTHRIDRCRHQAIANAVARVGSPELTTVARTE